MPCNLFLAVLGSYLLSSPKKKPPNPDFQVNYKLFDRPSTKLTLLINLTFPYDPKEGPKALTLLDESKKILVGLSMLKNPDGRFDVVQMNKIIGIVDYAHTPDALLNVLETISDIKNNEDSIITVVGCGGGRDKEKRFKKSKKHTI